MTGTAGSPVGTMEPDRPFTVDDLAEIPDDGRRYELIDGEMLVSPAPGWAHQEVAYTLYTILRAACPAHLRVVGAPFSVRLDQHNELQPDVLVARFEDLTASDLPTAPLLAVEVISPSSRLSDATLKQAAYARMGVPSFWLIDPDKDHSLLTAFELAAGGQRLEYRELTQVGDHEPFEAIRPFEVRIVPSDLVAKLHP